MSNPFFTLVTLASLTFLVVPVVEAQHSQMPSGMTHDEHLARMKKDAELKERGTAAMGFDQDAATHHFLLFDDGGAIDVNAGREDDIATRDAIRAHLQDIAREFANGTFDKPFATHAEIPPGAAAMARLKDRVTYGFEATARGGRVRISSRDTEAVAAVHAFLRYQIIEHKTGDPLTPRKR